LAKQKGKSKSLKEEEDISESNLSSFTWNDSTVTVPLNVDSSDTVFTNTASDYAVSFFTPSKNIVTEGFSSTFQPSITETTTTTKNFALPHSIVKQIINDSRILAKKTMEELVEPKLEKLETQILELKNLIKSGYTQTSDIEIQKKVLSKQIMII